MKLQGKATFAPNTSDLVARATRVAFEAVTEVSENVLRQAQILVPIDTGFLYNSGSSRAELQGAQAIGTVEFSADYAWYVEFGTVKMDAQPYLRPALDGSHGLLIDTAAEKMKGVLNV